MKRISVVAVVMVSLLSAGCGAISGARQAAQQEVLRNDLKQVGMAYLNYHDVHTQGPADWDAFIEASPEDAAAIQRVRDAGYQIKWGVKLREVTEGAANFVLAESPGGGPKLYLDGSVQTP